MLECQDRILNTTEAFDKKLTCENNNCFIHFILMVIICLLLLIVICVNCYFYYTKHRSKQKNLLPFHDISIKLKEIDVKNCTCYYFDEIIKIEDFHFNNILTDEKSYKNILVYNILMGAKSLCIRFNKVDGFIRVYDGTRYLVLFGPEKYDAIYSRIRYVISQKSVIIYVISLNFLRIKIDSYDSFPLEKTLTLHNTHQVNF